MKRVCLLALVLMAGTTQAAQNIGELDRMTECVGYAAQMPAGSVMDFEKYTKLHHKIYEMYPSLYAKRETDNTQLAVSFSIYWGLFGVQKPLLTMVNLAQSTDAEALQSAAVKLWDDKNCELVTK